MDAATVEDILDAVREFVRQEVVPAEPEFERTDSIPERLHAQARAMGLFGYALPEQYGGLDLTMTQECRLVMELGWAAPAFRSMFGTNNGIAGQVLVEFGTQAQRDRWLPGLASGELVASFALTEPEAGSDPSGLRTRAVPDAASGGWLVSGHKRFITNAPEADLLMVFARTGADDEGTRGISVIVVPTDAPGVTITGPSRKMGQKGAHVAEVFLDAVPVPADHLVGERPGEGYPAAMRSLVRGRLTIAAVCAGLAQRLVHEMVAVAKTSEQGGAPIARFQLVQAMLAESATEAYAARAAVLAAAADWDSGVDRRLAPSAAKLYCSEAVDRIADRFVQVSGGSGYMHESPAERFYRDARLFRLYEGTSEIQKLIIAGALLR